MTLRHKIFHRIARVVSFVMFNFAFFFFTRMRIRGRENIPMQGPLVVVSNHLSYADQYILTLAIKREMIFLAKEELFRNRFKRFLIESFGAIPVRRGAVNRAALNQVHRVLDKGQAMFLFPEGSRSKDARLQPAFSGSALIALHNSAPILPVGIWGMEAAEKGFSWVMRHRPEVTVNIGKPFYLSTPDERLNKSQLKELSDEIMVHIAGLLPTEYRGYYADRVDPGDTPSSNPSIPRCGSR